MTKFHSPYHFIPVDINEAKETTRWEKPDDLKAEENHYLRHDYWHLVGESGRITCHIKCTSPLVIGGEQISGNKTTPGKVKPYQHPDGTVAIPGNSLRGMVSSLAEAISQSAMRVLTSEKESTYSVRKPVGSAQHMRLGLLYKKDEKFRICPLSDGESVGNYDNGNQDTCFIRSQDTYQHQKNQKFVFRSGTGTNSLSDESGPGKIKGVLYIRTKDEKSTKLHESFIPWNEENMNGKIERGEGTEIPTVVVQTTENILRMRHKADKDKSFTQLPKGYLREWQEEKKLSDREPIIQDGDLIYYLKEGDVIKELSYSVIWRSPVKGGSPHQAFAMHCGNNSLPWNKDRSALTPAEAIFGVVEDEPEKGQPARNIASRVRFTDATPNCRIELGPEITLKILASPKPPSPAMYFSTVNGYVAKNKLDMNKHTPNGRKQYLPHPKRENTWEADSEKEQGYNWKPHLKCTPIPAESKFTFYIHYENLSKAELGLLLTALEPEAGFIHRLGLGKPLGLGQITLELIRVERIDRVNRYLSASLLEKRFTTLSESVDTSLIDERAHQILQALGNPKNIKHNVSYPYTRSKGQKCHPESEGFQWFMENDSLNSGQQYLKPIKPGEPIPTLNSSFPRIKIPLSAFGPRKSDKPQSHEIKRAIRDVVSSTIINGLSLSGGNGIVYLDSNQDIERLKNEQGEVVITLRGRLITCEPFPQEPDSPV